MATTLGLSGPAWACLSAHCVQVRVDTGRLDLSSDVAAGRFLLQGSMTTMNGDVLGPGALVGPSSLFPGVPADPIASSSDAALLVLPAPAFDRLREAHPQVALDVLGAVATAIVQRGSGTATWRRDICKWRRLACLGEMRVQSALQERDRLQKDVDELRREVRRAVGAHRHCDAREEALRAQLMQALRQVRSRQAALEAQVALNASLGRTAPPPARRLGSPTTLTRSVSSVAFGQPAPRSRYRLPNTIKTNGDDDGRRAATPAVCTFRKTYDQVDLCVGSTRPGTAQDGPGTTRRATGTPAVVVECRQQRRAQHCQASSTLVPFSERAMNREMA
ncbi:Uncharacterized protein PBTT_05194 [Plasmodiophora brassicae]